MCREHFRPGDPRARARGREILWSRADPDLRRLVLDKYARDEDYYKKTGDPMRHDVQNARRIFANQGFKGLFHALDSGKVALPGLAGATLLGQDFEGRQD
jgi:hypothetical protein